MVNVVVCPLLGATLIKLMLCNRTELERFPLHIRCVYFPTFARFLSNAGRRRASFGRRTRQRAATGHRQSCCTGIAPSPLELGAQVRHAEARVDVRLADRLALLLAALALLGALLAAAAAAAPPPRRVRVGEVEGAATGSTARPTATHLHQTDTSARPPSVSYRPAAHHPRRSSSALRDTPPPTGAAGVRCAVGMVTITRASLGSSLSSRQRLLDCPQPRPAGTAPTTSQPKRHLDRCSRFCRTQARGLHTQPPSVRAPLKLRPYTCVYQYFQY